jgi:TolB-like protein/Flp pilus assembly protein TadD
VAGAVAVLAIAAIGIMVWQPWAPDVQPASVERMAPPLPDKPSIAVLPFTNMSDDPSQEYFVDGMTEDLITDLAKIENLFVIARNTVFTYKDKSVVVPDMAKELGVKYALEGSVRRVGDQVRINTQLIDGVSGAHIWAERYDGTLADIFALQDEVTGEIVAQLQITLTPDEQNRQNRKGTNNSDAYDAYLRGWQLYRRFTPEDFAKAIPHLKRAVELDPDYGQAWAALASIYWITYRKGEAWSLIVNPDKSNSVSMLGSRDKAEIHLKQAIRDPTPLAHQVESQISWDYRQFEGALGEAKQAVALDPNDPEGHLAMAWALIFAGRAEAAIASTKTGLRLDPNFPGSHLFALGTAQLMLEHYEEAQATLQRALAFNPENFGILLPLGIAYARTGQQEEAKVTLQKYDNFSIFESPKIENYMSWWPFRRETDIRLFGGGLIKAGLCCENQFEAYIGKLRRGGTLE